jgi:hypothetical protein
MRITPKAIQEILDELEASKQSRLRAYSTGQKRSKIRLQHVSEAAD